MFHSAQTLAPLAGAKLERLRLSLNSPVVAVESLPVGPAAAGIALHRGPRGPRITIAVRSVRAGQLLFFHPDEAWRESEGFALEAALSFAESMGFLFDEDPIERGADPLDAARLWVDFLEEGAVARAFALRPPAEPVAPVAEPAEPVAEPDEPAAEPDEPVAEVEELAADAAAEADELAAEADELAAEADELAAEADELAAEADELPAEADELPAEVQGRAAEVDEAGIESDAAVVPCEPPLPPERLLSKFRFLSSIPAERLLSPPPVEEPAHNDSVLRLLSRF